MQLIFTEEEYDNKLKYAYITGHREAMSRLSQRMRELRIEGKAIDDKSITAEVEHMLKYISYKGETIEC